MSKFQLFQEFFKKKLPNESLRREMLCGIFDRIRQEEFKPGEDHVTQVQKVEADIIGKDKPVCYYYTNEENGYNAID